jgi:hypothetical protein
VSSVYSCINCSDSYCIWPAFTKVPGKAIPRGWGQWEHPKTLTYEGNIVGSVKLKHGSQVDPNSCLCQHTCAALISYCTHMLAWTYLVQWSFLLRTIWNPKAKLPIHFQPWLIHDNIRIHNVENTSVQFVPVYVTEQCYCWLLISFRRLTLTSTASFIPTSRHCLSVIFDLITMTYPLFDVIFIRSDCTSGCVSQAPPPSQLQLVESWQHGRERRLGGWITKLDFIQLNILWLSS